MKDIMKILKSLQDSGLLWKGVSEKIQNVIKEQKGGFLSMLLGASLLENMLTATGINAAGEGIIRAGYWSKKGIFNTTPSFKGYLRYKTITSPNVLPKALCSVLKIFKFLYF